VTVLDLFLVVAGIRHDITPSRWVTTLATTPSVANRVLERWDVTGYVWDEDDPNNRWGY
jgi:hypothetical protein